VTVYAEKHTKCHCRAVSVTKRSFDVLKTCDISFWKCHPWGKDVT